MQSLVGACIQVGVGAALVWSAWIKLRMPRGAFRDIVAAFGLLPRTWVGVVSQSVPWIESALALSLLSGAFVSYGAAGTSVLLALFGGAILVNLLRGKTDISCGCFGSSSKTLGWGLVGRNGALSVALAYSVAYVSPSWTERLAALGVVLVGAALAKLIQTVVEIRGYAKLTSSRPEWRPRPQTRLLDIHLSPGDQSLGAPVQGEASVP